MAHKMGLSSETHPRPTLLSDFILGSQDGLVNILGILLGLVAAGNIPLRIELVAALAAVAAESISMGAVAYTSTLSRRNLYLAELERERREMATVPETEREEVRVILRRWGYSGSELEEMLQRIESKPQAWLDIMMAFELNLSEVPAHAPRNSLAVVLTATVVGSFVPLIPFLAFRPMGQLVAALASIGLSGAALFGIGAYEARVTLGSFWKNGPRMLLIGLGAGLAGFLAGHFVSVL